ncbi:MAG: rod shape-determining protein MreC [Burkholderiales bacterium]
MASVAHQPPPFFARGPSPLARLTFFSLLCFLLLLTDGRYHYLQLVRQVASVALYPLQVLATSPFSLAANIKDYFASQLELKQENAELKTRNLEYAAQVQALPALRAENDRLRKLLEATRNIEGSAMLAEILYANRVPTSQSVVVDKGSQQGVVAGSAVVDEIGVVGQVTRVYPFVSEVTLITEKDQPVPIKVLRNGVRAVVFGSGSRDGLELKYMSVDADVRKDDELVTSGIDGTYPPGLPVAKVTSVERDPALPFATITAAPTAGVNRQREVIILSAKRDLPSDPRTEQAAEKGKAKP